MNRTFTRSRLINDVTLDDLPGMSRAELLDAWAQVVGKPPLASASREFVVNTIAWHLQARQFGGLTPSVQRKLERLATAIGRGEPSDCTPRPIASAPARPWSGRGAVKPISSPSWRTGSPIAASATGVSRRSRG